MGLLRWKDVQTLSEYAHKVAADAGWWETVKLDKVVSGTNMISVEVGEAIDAYRKGNKPDSKLPEFGSEVLELADVAIYALDMIGYLQSLSTTSKPQIETGDVPALSDHDTPISSHLLYSSLIIAAANASEKAADLYAWVLARKTGHADLVYALLRSLYNVISKVNALAALKGYDMIAAVKAKAEYNSVRLDHKREARSKDDGKKF